MTTGNRHKKLVKFKIKTYAEHPNTTTSSGVVSRKRQKKTMKIYKILGQH